MSIEKEVGRVPKGILYVESRPSSPEQAAGYHKWYNETHLQEILAIDGFVSARRFESLGEDGPFIAIYEIDADDIEAVQATLGAAITAGTMSTPVGLRFDPPPVLRFCREITAHES
ncbi:DUF4286 family protein [Frankia sp. Cr2]|uniref:DUF4286 family protein n=1 Tax=Frankia sp. Cr2 TaxID=3073932 RepID=UPI002AD2B71D|nr:DUF4286 family protein [Frankia sp. Cr2]